MARVVRQKSSKGLALENPARLTAQALELLRLGDRWEASVGAENHIKSLALYPPSASRNGQWLVIGKAWSGGHKLVAFHRASDPITALLGFLSKAEQQKLEWKQDKWGDEALAPPTVS